MPPSVQFWFGFFGGLHLAGLFLALPLCLGGVLFAADRSERTFDRSELALLGSLAAHAAIALDNARLLEETRAALDASRRGACRRPSAAVIHPMYW